MHFKNILVKIFSFLFYVIALLLCAISITELYYRFSIFGRSPVSIATDQYFQFIHERIDAQWAGIAPPLGNQANPLEPPLDVYSNENFNDTSRLDKIATVSRSLKNVKVMSYDFLNDKKYAEETKYLACFNNFGFRSCKNTQAHKNKNTTRIITYGSYHTFGHGVNEEDAYSNQLEKILNTQEKNQKFEVLNSGKHAGTAIIGLSLFRKDIEQFQPDLIVLDYGFVDTKVTDDVLPFVLLFKKESTANLLTKTWSFLINNSMTFNLIWKKITNAHRSERLQEFKNILVQTIDLAMQKNIKVVVIKQMPVGISPEFYENIIKKYPKNKVTFVNAETVFEKNYVKFSDLEMPKYHWWITIPSENQDILAKNSYFKYPKLRQSLFQLNEYGHTLIAQAVSYQILNVLINN